MSKQYDKIGFRATVRKDNVKMKAKDFNRDIEYFIDIEIALQVTQQFKRLVLDGGYFVLSRKEDLENFWIYDLILEIKKPKESYKPHAVKLIEERLKGENNEK